MATLTIRQLDERTKARLRVRAAEHGQSMEEEAREILRSALLSRPNLNDNLADIVRRRFAPLGGVELEPPPRDPIRKAEALFDIDLKDRVIGFDSDAARIFSRIAAHRRQQGKPISNPDAQVAAIAHLHSATLATRNVAAFHDCGVDVVDPWVVDR